MNITNQTELDLCKQELLDLKKMYNTLLETETSIKDFPFRTTDEVLSLKYYGTSENRLEKTFYQFQGFHNFISEANIIDNNSIEILLPPIKKNDDFKKYWSSLDSEKRKFTTSEYFKLVLFMHYFKQKQLINSIIGQLNNRRILTSVLISRAIFENTATLNSYSKLYIQLVLKNSLDSSSSKFPNSLVEALNNLKDKYENAEINDYSLFLFSILAHRFIYAGKNDLSLYSQHNDDWKEVFNSGLDIGINQNDSFFSIDRIGKDINFLEKQFTNAGKWYSIISEFVHPNAGSHNTVVFEKTGIIERNDERIDLQKIPDITLKEQIENEKNIGRIYEKYKLCSISNYDIRKGYQFLIEIIYIPLIKLINRTIDIMKKHLIELYDIDFKTMAD